MTTLRIYIFVLGTMALGRLTHAGRKTKCDVVSSLKAANVQDSEIRDCKSSLKNSLFQNKSHIKRESRYKCNISSCCSNMKRTFLLI